jgi:hypothetical protein
MQNVIECPSLKVKSIHSEIIGDYQYGFRRNRSTIDQIFYIRQIVENKREYNETIHQLFIVFKKAYEGRIVQYSHRGLDNNEISQAD